MTERPERPKHSYLTQESGYRRDEADAYMDHQAAEIARLEKIEAAAQTFAMWLDPSPHMKDGLNTVAVDDAYTQLIEALEDGRV